MPKIELISECFIGECFICPIEYDDCSGITEEEENQLNTWMANKQGCFFTYDDELKDEFARCEITGMMGACVHVLIYKML